MRPRFLMCLLLCLSGCGTSLTGPSSASGLPWSPYIGIHTNPQAMPGYRVALTSLQEHNALRGIRIRTSSFEPTWGMTELAKSLGLEIVGIVPNEELFEDDVEGMMDRVIQRHYPDVTIFQIGNELTTIIPRTQAQLPIEAYMMKLKRIYRHVRETYPDIILITQSTVSMTYGAKELRQMAKLGLQEMSPEYLIIGINMYNNVALNEVATIRNQYLTGYRVWVMEAGINNPQKQVKFVQDFYPRIFNILGAERIYWYVLWEGDDGSFSGSNLIWHPFTPNILTSALFNTLTGK